MNYMESLMLAVSFGCSMGIIIPGALITLMEMFSYIKRKLNK